MTDPAADQPAPSAGEKALGTFKGLVEAHPVAMLAGGLLLGALVTGAMTRLRKPSPKARPKRSFGKRAVQIAAQGVQLAVASAANIAPEAARSVRQPMGSVAEAALHTLGPVIRSRLGRKPVD